MRKLRPVLFFAHKFKCLVIPIEKVNLLLMSVVVWTSILFLPQSYHWWVMKYCRLYRTDRHCLTDWPRAKHRLELKNSAVQLSSQVTWLLQPVQWWGASLPSSDAQRSAGNRELPLDNAKTGWYHRCIHDDTTWYHGKLGVRFIFA